MAKLYTTRMTLNNACYMAKDYSHRVNSSCLGCKSCYRFASNNNERAYQSQWIDRELEFNKDLYMAPIFISRYCEPFYSSKYTMHSLFVAKKFLENNSQVIFSTYASEGFDNTDVMDLIEKYSKSIMIQFKLFNSEATEVERCIKQLLYPSLPMIEDVYTRIKRYDFIDKVIVIDPFIINVNHKDIIRIIERMEDLGVKKLILKQLFATNYFKDYLYSLTGKTNHLSVQVGNFWTYDNLQLLEASAPIIDMCSKRDIDIQFCNNRELNKILNNKAYNNCCMLENPIGVYNIDRNPMHRKKASIIK